MTKHLTAVLVFCLAEALSLAQLACAGVMPEQTRLIFQQGQSQRALMLVNTNAYPVVVQAWVDNGKTDQAPENAVSYMVVLPSVFRMQPRALQGIRIIYDGSALPQDRESVAWLNIYEIPPSKTKIPLAGPQMTVAMNTQIKVFYRPADLPDTASTAIAELAFSIQPKADEWVLRCNNPSPYHVSFSSLQIQLGGHELAVANTLDMMVAPFSERDYLIPEFNSAGLNEVSVKTVWIDDDGHSHEHGVTVPVRKL